MNTVALAQETLTNESIEKMAKAGLGDDVIVSMIQNQPGHYDLNPDTLVALKKEGLSDSVFHSSGGSTKDAVKFEQTRVARHTYKITMPANLAPGEYAFLAPGLTASSASGSAGKAYTFHLVE